MHLVLKKNDFNNNTSYLLFFLFVVSYFFLKSIKKKNFYFDKIFIRMNGEKEIVEKQGKLYLSS